MPSRRTFLAGLASAGVATTAGCVGGLDRLVGGGGPPAYTDWLHRPVTATAPDRYVAASLDVAAVRANRETLPDSARDALDRADRLAGSVSLADVDRLTALGYGAPDAGSAGLTLAAKGTFDTAAIRAEIGADDSSLVVDEGTREGFQRYSYEPSLFADLRQFQGDEQPTPPDLTFGLAASDAALVAGLVLSPDVRGLAAVRAAVDTHTGAETGVTDDRAMADLFATVGDRTLAVGLSTALTRDLATQVDDAATRSLLDDADGLGFGYALADETLRVALAADPTDLADPERVRTILEDATDDEGEDGPTVERVGVARSGRVVYADLAVPVARVVDAGENVTVTDPLGTPAG
ncbi:hypothetical protein [Halorarius litoreus]|uniref:hypothetical protein n=1 Tax=Halorarius litoreus TaxID=2962676 RepID=UPI0020CF55FE|nr:hypothetical protein [Halorarius litoreus]